MSLTHNEMMEKLRDDMSIFTIMERRYCDKSIRKALAEIAPKLSGYKAVGPYQIGHLSIAALFLVNDRSSVECFTQIYKKLNRTDQFLVDNFIEKYNEAQ